MSSAWHEAWLMLCGQPNLAVIMAFIVVIIFVFCLVNGLLKETGHIREQYCADKGVVWLYKATLITKRKKLKRKSCQF